MNKSKMQSQLKQSFNHASDGLFDDILADCNKERMLNTMETNTVNTDSFEGVLTNNDQQKETRRAPAWRRPRIALAATAAMLILIFGAVFAFQQIQSNRIATVVTLDVNPSIRLDVSKNDQVLKVLALNAEGFEILKDMKLENTDLNVAIHAIMGSMLKAGYMTDDSNTFLVSVDNPSEVKSANVRTLIVNQLEGLLASNRLDGMIISQRLKIDDAVDELADLYGISPGKAYLISHIHSKYTDIPLDILAAMEIGELADLFSHTLAQDDDIELHGHKPDEAQQMLLDRASVLSMLYDRWKLDPSNIRSASIQMMEGDQPAFKVEINVGENIYRAVVDAKTGHIISEEYKSDDDDDDDDIDDDSTTKPSVTQEHPQTSSTATKPTTSDPTSPTTTIQPTKRPTETMTPTTSTSQEKMMLSAADARKMVVARFGGTIQKIEYTYDDRNPMYKGEALKDGYKVVFEINARTSSWYKWDISNDNQWDNFTHALKNMISMNQAAQSVISKSGHSNTFVQKIDFLWDDEKPLYQGEAFNKGVKYSFEIYAYGGGYQKWSASTGDETWSEQYYNVR